MENLHTAITFLETGKRYGNWPLSSFWINFRSVVAENPKMLKRAIEILDETRHFAFSEAQTIDVLKSNLIADVAVTSIKPTPAKSWRASAEFCSVTVNDEEVVSNSNPLAIIHRIALIGVNRKEE